MEFKYGNTVDHGDVMFYVSPSGNQVYFVCGGCVIAVSRPLVSGATHGGMIKFGLSLRGGSQSRSEGDITLAEYVKSELKRRGMRCASSVEGGGHAFLDALDMMNHDPSCSERDLCGHAEVMVRDPCVAEYIVSMGVSSGLIVTAVTDSPRDRKLRLLEEPVVSNAYSGFVYDVDPGAFTLVQARLADPPQALCLLLEGLFDGIPGNRTPLKENDVPDRVDVIVTAGSSARVTAVKAGAGYHAGGYRAGYCAAPRYKRGLLKDTSACTRKTTQEKKSARICEYVQVKYIDPAVDIWAPEKKHDSASASSSQVRQSPRKSLAAVWSAYCRVSGALDETCADGWPEISNDLYEARAKMSEAADAVFGRSSPPFLPPAHRRALTVQQKFLLLQYVHSLQGLPNCYGLLAELCKAYGGDQDADSDPPVDRDAIADLISELFRCSAFIGAAVEIVCTADHRSADFLDSPLSATPSTDACMDADLLLGVAEEAMDDNYVCAERDARLVKLAVILDAVYGGEGLVVLASRESKCLGNSELLCAAIDVTGSSAFDHCPRMRRYCLYSSALVDSRLKDANLPSFYE